MAKLFARFVMFIDTLGKALTAFAADVGKELERMKEEKEDK
jgi:hypothetical protein